MNMEFRRKLPGPEEVIQMYPVSEESKRQKAKNDEEIRKIFTGESDKLLLVIGPPMEEKYGSGPLLKGILLTALISGILQCVLFPHTALLGASGIVFMLIMLASLSGFSGGIPVTMLLVAALYLGQQVYDIIFAHDNVANFMHIVGGVCGTAFGYVYAMLPRKRRRPAARKKR